MQVFDNDIINRLMTKKNWCFCAQNCCSDTGAQTSWFPVPIQKRPDSEVSGYSVAGYARKGVRMRGGVDALQRCSAICHPFWVMITVLLFSNMSLIGLNVQWTYRRQDIGIADSFSRAFGVFLFVAFGLWFGGNSIYFHKSPIHYVKKVWQTIPLSPWPIMF